jgi:hypothetical protein
MQARGSQLCTTPDRPGSENDERRRSARVSDLAARIFANPSETRATNVVLNEQ